MQQKYLIWSEEHLAWWHRNKHQYVRSIFLAGRFTEREASEIVKNANAFLDPEQHSPFNEIIIPDPVPD